MAVSTATAATATSEALAANPRRIYLAVCNTSSSESAFLNFGAAAEVNKGWLVPPLGTFEMNTVGINEGWSRLAINCIRGASADAILSVAEIDES